MKITALAAVFGLGFSALAAAHPTWMLPSHFSVSKAEGDWITFDYTASHTAFQVDKPASAHDARVLLPSGASVSPDHILRGKRRSVFDFYFEEAGTHKVTVNSQAPRYMTIYTDRQGNRGRRGANKIDRDNHVPRGAQNIQTLESTQQTESYITVMAPTPIKARNQGFEMLPITHPSDLIAGEAFTVRYLVDGKPVEGLTVNITREGALYRAAQEAIESTTNAQGDAVFTAPIAGRYLLAAEYRYAIDSPLADMRAGTINTTLEVQPK
ncbi:MAG: DUF4198 domain-containing protein [Ferrimonas sp.]